MPITRRQAKSTAQESCQQKNEPPTPTPMRVTRSRSRQKTEEETVKIEKPQRVSTGKKKTNVKKTGKKTQKKNPQSKLPAKSKNKGKTKKVNLKEQPRPSENNNSELKPETIAPQPEEEIEENQPQADACSTGQIIPDIPEQNELDFDNPQEVDESIIQESSQQVDLDENANIEENLEPQSIVSEIIEMSCFPENLIQESENARSEAGSVEVEFDNEVMEVQYFQEESTSNYMQEDTEEPAYEFPTMNVEETSYIVNEKPETEQPTPQNFRLPSQLLPQDEIDRIQKMFDEPQPESNGYKSTTTPVLVKDMSLIHLYSEEKMMNAKSKPRALICPLVSQYFYNVKSNEVDQSCIQFTASFRGFRPTVSSNYPHAIAMSTKTINIGRGSHNHVNLDLFGYCNFTSPLHAVVFYDEFSKKFELLNYSPYGTLINNVMYGINTSLERPSSRMYGWYSGKYERKIYTKVYRRCNSTMKRGCLCDREDVVNSSEETITLKHGAAISFGCIPFIFSQLKYPN